MQLSVVRLAVSETLGVICDDADATVSPHLVHCSVTVPEYKLRAQLQNKHDPSAYQGRTKQ